MSEIWRAVVGFEGLYEVSDLGRVRSLDRVIESVGAARGYPKRVRGRVLKPQWHSQGYAQVGLCSRVHLVHAIVLAAFVGVAPLGTEGAHGDGDKWNNRLSNLRYATPLSNAADRVVHGTSGKGEKNAQAVLTDDDVIEIRRRIGEGEPYVVVAEDFPVTDRTIGKIARRERWAHV